MEHPATGEALSRRSGQIDALRIIAVTALLFDHFGLVLGHGPIGRLGVQIFRRLCAGQSGEHAGRTRSSFVGGYLTGSPRGVALRGEERDSGPVGQALDLKVLQYLGRISLGVYLYQFIALDVVSHIFPWLPRKGPVLVALIAMTAVGLAMISWHLVEKPIGSLKAMANYKAHRVRTRSLMP